MGFFSGLKTAGGYVFNFRVKKWLGYDDIKENTANIFGIGRSVFSPEQAEHTETFEQALKRLNISENELHQRLAEFSRLMITYLIVAAMIFAYSIYIVFAYKNFFGFLMGFAITLYALTYAFRYHFWIFQIKHRKLGCTIKDWFLDQR